MKAQGAATVSKAPRCPPGWDAKAEAKDGPKYRAEFLARQVRGRDDVSDASPLFEKNLVRPNLFILLCPQDGIRCICCTWEKCSVNQWVMRPSGSTMLYVDMLSIYWSFIIGLPSSIYMKCFLYRYVWLSVQVCVIWIRMICTWLFLASRQTSHPSTWLSDVRW